MQQYPQRRVYPPHKYHAQRLRRDNTNTSTPWHKIESLYFLLCLFLFARAFLFPIPVVDITHRPLLPSATPTPTISVPSLINDTLAHCLDGKCNNQDLFEALEYSGAGAHLLPGYPLPMNLTDKLGCNVKPPHSDKSWPQPYHDVDCERKSGSMHSSPRSSPSSMDVSMRLNNIALVSPADCTQEFVKSYSLSPRPSVPLVSVPRPSPSIVVAPKTPELEIGLIVTDRSSIIANPNRVEAPRNAFLIEEPFFSMEEFDDDDGEIFALKIWIDKKEHLRAKLGKVELCQASSGIRCLSPAQ